MHLNLATPWARCTQRFASSRSGLAESPKRSFLGDLKERERSYETLHMYGNSCDGKLVEFRRSGSQKETGGGTIAAHLGVVHTETKQLHPPRYLATPVFMKLLSCPVSARVDLGPRAYKPLTVAGARSRTTRACLAALGAEQGRYALTLPGS